MRSARIDLGAISRNTHVLSNLVGVPVMAVVKANGYGHGAVESARAALVGGAEWLGVVDTTEALALRAAGIRAPVLAWLHAPDADFAPAIAAHIDLGVNNLAQLEQIASAGGRAAVHLKVDTGLSRNGAVEADWDALFTRAAELERLGRVHVRGVFSHLANAGADADAGQVAGFERALGLAAASGLHPEVTHLAATAAAVAAPATRFGMVRLGIGLYGLSPVENELDLTPAMELSAEIAAVKRVPTGSGVSYGHAWVAARPTTLALVPLGYADGVPRAASGAAEVLVEGVRRPVVGRIAMDQFMIDLGDDEVPLGTRAVLFGDPASGAPSATDWADAASTIDYEIVTRIGPRVAREYV
jgi:alanine racemase